MHGGQRGGRAWIASSDAGLLHTYPAAAGDGAATGRGRPEVQSL